MPPTRHLHRDFDRLCQVPNMAICRESAFPVARTCWRCQMLNVHGQPCSCTTFVRAAVNGLGRCYHIERRSSILQDLECAIQNHHPTGSLNKSKLLVVFAIGEMYTTRNSTSEKAFPGIHYFCKAMNVLRLVSERPSVDMVEIQPLLVRPFSPILLS